MATAAAAISSTNVSTTSSSSPPMATATAATSTDTTAVLRRRKSVLESGDVFQQTDAGRSEMQALVDTLPVHEYERVQLAASWVHDAMFKHESHLIDSVDRVRLFRVVYHRLVKKTMLLLSVCHCALILFEPPSSHEWSWNATHGFELVFLLSHVLHSLLLTFSIGVATLFSSKWKTLNVVLTIASLIDLTYSWVTGPDHEYFRVSRLCRIFFLVQHAKGIRERFEAMVATISALVNVYILMSLELVLFGAFGYVLFHDVPNYTHFASLSESMMQLFILLTTANFPDIMLPATAISRWYAWYFVVFLIIGLYLLTNLLLGTVYNAYKIRRVHVLQKKQLKQKRAIRRAFEMLDHDNVGSINLRQWLVLCYCIDPSVSKDMCYVLWYAIDVDANNVVDKHEFSHVCSYLGRKLKFRRRKKRAQLLAPMTPTALLCRSVINFEVSFTLLPMFSKHHQHNSGAVGVGVGVGDSDGTRLTARRVRAHEQARECHGSRSQKFTLENLADDDFGDTADRADCDDDNDESSVDSSVDDEDYADKKMLYFGYALWHRLRRMFAEQHRVLVTLRFFDIIVIANACIVLYRLQEPDEPRDVKFEGHEPVELWSWLFLCGYIIEMVLKIGAFGFAGYYQYHLNRLDFVLTIINVVGEVVIELVAALSDHSVGLARSYLRLSRLLRLVDVLSPDFHILLKTLRVIIPPALSLFSLLFCVFYWFAVIGMHVFAGKMSPDQVSSDNVYATSNYFQQNFDDFPASMTTLFSLVVVNNWFVIMSGAVDVTNRWSRIFFIAFYVICVPVVLNTLIGFILDSFFIKLEEKKAEEQHHITHIFASQLEEDQKAKAALSKAKALAQARAATERAQRQKRKELAVGQRPSDAHVMATMLDQRPQRHGDRGDDRNRAVDHCVALSDIVLEAEAATETLETASNDAADVAVAAVTKNTSDSATTTAASPEVDEPTPMTAIDHSPAHGGRVPTMSVGDVHVQMAALQAQLSATSPASPPQIESAETRIAKALAKLHPDKADLDVSVDHVSSEEVEQELLGAGGDAEVEATADAAAVAATLATTTITTAAAAAAEADSDSSSAAAAAVTAPATTTAVVSDGGAVDADAEAAVGSSREM